MKPKILKVQERYKFPRGVKVAEVRERTFGSEFTASQLNRSVFPHECVDGWYVIDAVKISPSQVVVTFGLVEFEFE